MLSTSRSRWWEHARGLAWALACAVVGVAIGEAQASPSAGIQTISGEVIGRERVRQVKLDAARIDDDAIVIDGRLDERAWLAVPTLPTMIQTEPRFGAAPTHATEVRVAYGDKGIYVAFQCDDDPAHVRGAFARKDQYVPSDTVLVEIDPNNDDTTGFRFVVNPSAAQADAQLFRDDYAEWLWDGVWRSAAKKNERGWAAEIFVPWSTLRFDSQESYTFGINTERWINNIGERSRLSPTPQGLPGVMSYALDYRGVTGVEPGLNVELRPYASLRIAAQRPEGSLDLSPTLLPNGGYDVKYGLRGNLTLDLAVNPDFGQAEVDPAVLNLGPFEVYFPERRTFFLESKEIFETRFSLFYSRRVGRAPRPSSADLTTRGEGDSQETAELVGLDPLTRIFGALRLTGQVAPGWSIGVLSATTGATSGVERFANGSERRVSVDPLTQYSVLRLRREFDSQTSVGLISTMVNRGSGDADAFTGGVDYRIRFRERWRHAAQVIGTHDGEDAGMGASADLRRGGRNLEVATSMDMLTPRANFNDLGYMRFANYITGRASAYVFNAQPFGKVRTLRAGPDGELSASFEGLMQVKRLNQVFELTTEKFWYSRLLVGGHWPQLDLYETRGGIPYEVPRHWYIVGSTSTPTNQRVTATVRGAYGEQAGKPGPDMGIEFKLRPVDRLEVTASLDINLVFGRPRWTTRSADDEPVFGRGDLFSYTGVLRATLGILPTLTLQTFNQLLYSTAHHTDFFILTDPRTLVPTDPTPYFGVVDQALTSLISNSILRWEYIPGSFLFVAYTHRTTLSEGGMEVRFDPRRGFTNLAAMGARNEDIVFVKLVHLFSL